MFDVVTFGAASQDNFIKVSAGTFQFIPDPKTGNELLAFEHNAKIPVEEAASFPGGGALNTALALKQLGLSPLVVTAVGWDNFGDIILQKLKEKRIRDDYVLHLQGVHTAFSTILTTEKGDRTAFVYGGVSDHLTKELLPDFEKLSKAKIFVVSHLRGKGHNLLKDIFELKKKNPEVRIAWNPGSTQIQHGIAGLKNFLTQTDVFLVNKEEAEALLEKDHPDTIELLAQEIHKSGVHIAVVTDGHNGAVAVTKRGVFMVKEFPTEVVNTTGAGDSFFAGLVAGLHATQDIQKGLLFGAINAASTIAHLGAQNGYLTKEEIETRINKHPEFQIRKLGY
jgi:sugar/nucleoside kinase (ribokinase family)